jgi:hypothetical protein
MTTREVPPPTRTRTSAAAVITALGVRLICDTARRGRARASTVAAVVEHARCSTRLTRVTVEPSAGGAGKRSIRVGAFGFYFNPHRHHDDDWDDVGDARDGGFREHEWEFVVVVVVVVVVAACVEVRAGASERCEGEGRRAASAVAGAGALAERRE